LPLTVHIAIDAMGGDAGPRPCVFGALDFLALNPSAQLTLVGDERQINSLIPSVPPQITILSASNPVEMGDRPSQALRQKRQSSMALAVELVADGKAHACVSAGNTGALMAFGLHLLGAMPGIERPAICKAVPTKNGVCWLLDLGANLDCSAENLYQFALMGAALARLNGVAIPRVALLNVGSEAHKGRELQQDAARLLAHLPGVTFCGFVEAGTLYRGVVDVVVCDGFSGNVLLKASEGAAELLQTSLREALQSNFLGRLAAILARHALSGWSRHYNPARLNGASFLGLQGVVVKSHGATSAAAFCAALQVAYEQVVNRIVDSISAAIASG
jgi:glycerol-3-phosphate acyltransferase PlsX